MKGIKKKFEDAAWLIFRKAYEELSLEAKRNIRYMVCTEVAIEEEKEERAKKVRDQKRR